MTQRPGPAGPAAALEVAAGHNPVRVRECNRRPAALDIRVRVRVRTYNAAAGPGRLAGGDAAPRLSPSSGSLAACQAEDAGCYGLAAGNLQVSGGCGPGLRGPAEALNSGRAARAALELEGLDPESPRAPSRPSANWALLRMKFLSTISLIITVT
jgi:hypothetical protein